MVSPGPDWVQPGAVEEDSLSLLSQILAPETISDSIPSAAILSGDQTVITWNRNARSILAKLYVCKRDCLLQEWSNFTPCFESGGKCIRYR